MATYKVGYFVGSLSSTSINRLLAKALVRLAPPELELIEIPIKDLPLYSQDYDADFPSIQTCNCRSGRHTICYSRVQSFNPRWVEERY